jgi:hypothetical protein
MAEGAANCRARDLATRHAVFVDLAVRLVARRGYPRLRRHFIDFHRLF